LSLLKNNIAARLRLFFFLTENEEKKNQMVLCELRRKFSFAETFTFFQRTSTEEKASLAFKLS